VSATSRRFGAGHAAVAAAAATLLLIAGCAEDEQGGDDPTPGETGQTAEAEGPECVGDEAAAGTHVLRGGEATLPGGGTVSYEQAEADGTTRRAGLSQGGGGGPELLGLDEQLTVEGNAYTVSQICTYRTVLTSDDPQLAPDPLEPDPEWPDADGGEWTLQQGITDDQPDEEPSLSVALTSVGDDPLTATIVVRSDGGVTVANYSDVAVGATVEIGAQLWQVAEIDAGNGAPASVRLELLGPAAP
jgi:hypothetical protein